MDGNDLGMIARVFMFLLKGLKYVLKLVWFTGLWWFCVLIVRRSISSRARQAAGAALDCISHPSAARYPLKAV